MISQHDDATREIRLGGKQLLFVFMAGTVVSVVVFLLGVQVGRGVSAQRGSPDLTGAASPLSTAAIDDRPAPSAAAPGSAAASAAPGASERLSYTDRLNSAEPAAEQLRSAEAPPAVAEAEGDAPPVPAKTPKAAISTGEPSGGGFAIQVAALRERAEADTIVARLVGKGYPAYVVDPAKGAPSVFRVRVGKFKTRGEADAASARLQKEEQFKPWLVR